MTLLIYIVFCLHIYLNLGYPIFRVCTHVHTFMSSLIEHPVCQVMFMFKQF